MIGYALCGSFCTAAASISALCELAAEAQVLPIVSESFARTDTRFGRASELVGRVERLCQRTAVKTIVDAEPLGPVLKLDALIIAPCTGNTLAKLAHGITDGPVTMAAKAHLRQGRPLLIALASNDAMSANLQSIALLSMRKGVYFVPMRQDDPEKKPYSLVADFSLIPAALDAAFGGRQLRPIFLECD